MKFYDSEGQPIGWIVDLEIDGEAHGYVIFDGTNADLISEYSFDEQAKSPISQGKATSLRSEGGVVKVYKTDIMTYSVVDSVSGGFVTNYGTEGVVSNDILADSRMRASDPVRWDDIFFDSKMGNYNVSSTGFINSAPIFVPQYASEANSKLFACSVNALGCVSLYYGLSNYNSIWSDLPTIWDCTNTTEYQKKPNGVRMGSTQDSEVGPGWSRYCAAKGRSIPYTYNTSVTFSFFKSCIDRGDIAHMGCGIWTWDDSGKVIQEGHGMAVEGYQQLSIKDKSLRDSTFMPNVIIVSDGWNTNPRFINLDSVAWYRCSGVGFYG